MDGRPVRLLSVGTILPEAWRGRDPVTGPAPLPSRPGQGVAAGDRQLLFSIVIPTYERPELLERCLDSILALHEPVRGFEVIVVDDGGHTDLRHHLRELLVRFEERGLGCQLLHQANAGPAAARNRGSQQACGRWLAFTDDDCLVDPNWLLALQEAIDVAPDALLGGKIVNGLQGNPFATTSQDLLDYLYLAGAEGRFSAPFFGTANLALRTQAFLAIGGFETLYTRAAAEDREFSDRWLQQGGTLRFVPDAQLVHSHAMGLREFCRQHLAYGRGARQFHRARAIRRAAPIRIESLWFYIRLLAFPFRRWEPSRALRISTLLLLSQLTSLVGFLLE